MAFELDEYCPCCYYNTFEKANRLNYSICPICYWEDDPIALKNPKFSGTANQVSLIEARINFEKYGACEKDIVRNTRKPTKNDLRKEIQN